MAYKREDAITISVRKQIEAFANAGAHRFKVQCVPDGELRGQPKLKGEGTLHPWKPYFWTSEQILKNLGMLKRRNVEGFNIFIAPLPDTEGDYAPLVFVDDILPDALKEMVDDGVVPAILIESSRGKFQGWIRMKGAPLSAEEIVRVQRLLVQKYGLDGGAIGAEQNGRLAGFRNVKAKYLDGHTFSKLIYADTRAVDMDTIVSEQETSNTRSIEATTPKTSRSMPKPIFRATPALKSPKVDIDTFWFNKHHAKPKPSESESEFSTCLACLREGYALDEVENALFRNGYNLIERKRSENEAWVYVKRTVAKAALIIFGS